MIKKLLWLLLLLLTQVSAQQANLDYYPLQVGNEWAYRELIIELIDGKWDTFSIDTIFTRVIGDSIFPNGLKYYHLTGINGGFRRSDSLTGKVYEIFTSPGSMKIQEHEIFDLSIEDSISWVNGYGNFITIRTSTTKKQVGLLDEYALEKTFEGAYLFPNRTLSKGFGVSYYEYGCVLPLSLCTLIGAKISDTVYSMPTKISQSIQLPKNYKVHNVYPNPFNSSTQISFYMPYASFVSVKICNVLGQEVNTLIEDTFSPGTHHIKWDATEEKSGLYFIKISFDQNTILKKCLLIK